jgi:hypothetical protein
LLLSHNPHKEKFHQSVQTRQIPTQENEIDEIEEHAPEEVAVQVDSAVIPRIT